MLKVSEEVMWRGEFEHNARTFPFLGDSQEGVKRASP